MIHELGELGSAEELPYRGGYGADVEQGLRGDGFCVLGGHPLAYHLLHAVQTAAELVLYEFPHLADVAVGEVVDVVGLHGYLHHFPVADSGDCLLSRSHGAQVPEGGADVLLGQPPHLGIYRQAQLLIDLVSADPGQVVAAVVEVEAVQQDLSALGGGGVVGADELCDLFQGHVPRFRRGASLHRLGAYEVEHDGVSLKLPAYLLYAHPHALQEDDHGDFLAPVDPDVEFAGLADLKLQPCSPGRYDPSAEDLFVLLGVGRASAVEVHPRAPDELGDYDPFGP